MSHIRGCCHTGCERNGDVLLYEVIGKRIQDCRSFCLTHLESSVAAPVWQHVDDAIPDVVESDIDMVFCAPAANSFMLCFRAVNGMCRWNYRVNARNAATAVAILSGGDEDNCVYQLAYDLMKVVNAIIVRATIYQEDGAYTADAVIEVNDCSTKVQISPINAILLACRGAIPLFVSRSALKAAAVN